MLRSNIFDLNFCLFSVVLCFLFVMSVYSRTIMCECCGGDCFMFKPEVSPANEMSQCSEVALKQLEECLEKGWLYVQPKNRPDQSFRMMIEIMWKWKDFINSTQANPVNMITRIEDIGRARQLLKSVLEDPIFDMTNKHNVYWESNHEAEHQKLDDLRCKISGINDNLWAVLGILEKEI